MRASSIRHFPPRAAVARMGQTLCALAMICTGTAAAADPADLFLPPDAIVAGRGLDWYAKDWWQWAFSAPADQSPVEDRTGAMCGVHQQGPVWYLAGGFGTSRIDRRCTIPADRHLFFPIINTAVITTPDLSNTCPEVRARAATFYSDFVYLVVKLDGVQLPDLHRTRISPDTCFDLAGRVGRDAAPRPFYPTATDGYWVMLAPLPPGDHHLEFRGFYSNPDDAGAEMVQNITYDLHIEAAP